MEERVEEIKNKHQQAQTELRKQVHSLIHSLVDSWSSYPPPPKKNDLTVITRKLWNRKSTFELNL